MRKLCVEKMLSETGRQGSGAAPVDQSVVRGKSGSDARPGKLLFVAPTLVIVSGGAGRGVLAQSCGQLNHMMWCLYTS